MSVWARHSKAKSVRRQWPSIGRALSHALWFLMAILALTQLYNSFLEPYVRVLSPDWSTLLTMLRLPVAPAFPCLSSGP